jgi:hypothetical protein
METHAHESADLVAEAVDATSSAYTDDPGLAVEARLAEELARRGVGPRGQAWLVEVAQAVRGGHAQDLVRDPRRQFPTS